MYLPSAFPQAAALEAELLMPQPQPLYISLLKNTKLLRQPNLSFFSMLLADKIFKYVMVLFLLEIGDNVKKQNFLHGSGRGSGKRRGGARCLESTVRSGQHSPMNPSPCRT